MHHNVTDPSLLSTYSTERQPVGYQIIIQANDGFRDHFKIWEALDVASPDVESRKAILKALSPPMVAGSQRRRSFQQAITNSPHEFHRLGIEWIKHTAERHLCRGRTRALQAFWKRRPRLCPLP
jgi:hypothetical protein